MRILPAILIALCVTANAVAEQPVLLVLLGGQSNMAGVGRVADLDDKWLEPFAAVPVWHDGAWRPVKPGLVGHKPEYFGPEVSLARALHEAWPDRDVRLIKHAVSGRNLAVHWAANKGYHYKRLNAEIKAAVADLDAAGRDYQFAGMLWLQGESDTRKPDYAAAYERNLRDLVAAIRHDTKTPKLPFVIGRITPHYDSTPPAGNAQVRAAQEAVAAADDHVVWFDTDDVEMADYNPGHYGSQGQLELGRRYAETLVALIASRL